MQALLRAESSPLQVLVLCFSYLDSYVSFYVTNGFTLRFLTCVYLRILYVGFVQIYFWCVRVLFRTHVEGCARIMTGP